MEIADGLNGSIGEELKRGRVILDVELANLDTGSQELELSVRTAIHSPVELEWHRVVNHLLIFFLKGLKYQRIEMEL